MAIWKRSSFIQFVVIVINLIQADSQTLLDICTNPTSGSPCRLTCRTTDVSRAIFFLKLPASGSPEGGCTSGGTCGAAPGRTRYTVTQNAALSETYLDISSLVYADDDCQWACEYGLARSTAVQLTVTSRLTAVRFAPDPSTASLPQTIVGEAFCVYPVSSLTMRLVYSDGQNNITLDMTDDISPTIGTNGCDAHESTVTRSYQLTPTTLTDISVRFWIEAAIPGLVVGSSLTTVTFVFPDHAR